jgi:hypothetical protein
MVSDQQSARIHTRNNHGNNGNHNLPPPNPIWPKESEFLSMNCWTMSKGSLLPDILELEKKSVKMECDGQVNIRLRNVNVSIGDDDYYLLSLRTGNVQTCLKIAHTK